MPQPWRIRAFGACMIGGFPHRYEDSFFHLALERLKRETKIELAPSIFTLGGFPVTRVPKHLATRCLAAQPDIVVLQFGASDLIVPIRRASGHSGSGLSPVQRTVSTKPPTLKSLLKWRFRALLAEMLQLPTVTPPKIYLETMIQLAQTLLAHRVIPVVVSPFVFGGSRSDRCARGCAARLQAGLSALPQAVYVEAYAALDRHPRRRMLLSDGTHLSLAGHQVVGESLFPSLKKLVEPADRSTGHSLAPSKPEVLRRAAC